MKAIRRSIRGDKGNDTSAPRHQKSISQKDAVAIVPPKKVIRALYDYEANPEHPHELSFSRGDFFHVIGRENDEDWYEACNPSMPNARGLVPVKFFQVLGRTERDSAGSATSNTSNRVPDNDSGYSERSAAGAAAVPSDNAPQPMRLSRSIGKGSGAMVYGIVQYDFVAERPDELEAKAGEAIIVIAQSNPEWFVAKPIGRLGGPGLIPVSFIEIRDMTTGQAVPDAQEAVQRAGVPKVEEWKKMAADYKNSSISLGRFETQGTPSMQEGMERLSLQNGAPNYRNGNTNGNTQVVGQNIPQRTERTGGTSVRTNSRPSSAQLMAPISANIPRFCFANEKYWYIIEAVMEDGRHWELSRFYQDFYDFQIALLTQFPEEAGNAGKPRTLPFMPGPVTYVTDAISNGRRQNLDEYIKKLLTMPPYISKCHLVRQLFAPRDGDFEIDPNAPLDDYRLSGTSQRSSNDSPEDVSRQSSRGDLNGSGQQPGLSAPPARPNNQRAQQAMPGAPSGHFRNPSDFHPGMNRQASSITQESAGSQGAGGSNTSGAMKIKVYFQDDLIAIRVQTDIKFEQLKEKLLERLHIEGDIMVQYKDEPSNTYVELMTNNDLNMARERNSKLTLFVSNI